MKNYLLPLVSAVLLINHFAYSSAYGADFKSVSEVINHYKDQIVNLDNLDAEEKNDFVTSYPGRSPGIVKGDFNGDGNIDVALLTKRSLLFFICTERCKLIRSDGFIFSGIQVIVPIKKGQLVEEFGGFDNGPRTPSVRLKNTAVHLIYLGKASIAFYWDSTSNNFNDITTGD